jgi:hypothetical protein
MQDFLKVHRDGHDTFEQKEITWVRNITHTNRFMESDDDNGTISIPLKVQCNYNYMRSWPITRTTEAGELDRQSMQVLINKSYLRELGYINANDFFDYSPDFDRFIIDGMIHKPMGDTSVSQVDSSDVLIVIVMQRQPTKTGDKRT